MIRRPNERKRIDTQRPEEIDLWCEYFRVPCSYLFEATNSVGSIAADVHDFLKSRRMLPPASKF